MVPDAHPGRACALRRLLRHRGGAAALEFALVAAPFIALLLASIETALVFFTQEAMETVAEKAARRVLTGGSQTAGTSSTDFKQAACNDLPSYLKCANLYVDVRRATNFAAVDTTRPTVTYDASGNVSNSFSYELGNAGDIVILRLLYLWPVSTAPFGLDLSNAGTGKRLIVATSVAKTEPYS